MASACPCAALVFSQQYTSGLPGAPKFFVAADPTTHVGAYARTKRLD
jgi:hypothetical protein